MILLGAFVPVATVPMIVVLLVAIFTVYISNGFSSIKLSYDAMGWRIANAVRPISHALFAGLELRFGRRSSSKLINSSTVLRTEPLLKPCGLLIQFVEQPCRYCNQSNDHNAGNNDPL